MKIIDYLVKLANKEADNITIRTNDYFDEFFGNCRYDYIEDGLNSEVEIIEEKKKISEKLKTIEKFDIYDDSMNWCCNDRAITDTEKDIIDKINEIIDYLKSKGE